MLLNQEKTDKLLALLKRRYPRWSGFSDQRFSRDADALRPDTLEGVELLNEASLRELAQERRWDEIIGRIDFVGRSAATASQNAPAVAELDALHAPAMDKAAFCGAIIELMFGDDDSPARLQRYADQAAASQFPNGWSLPTFLLMLLHPFTDCLVQTEAIGWFLDFAGNPFALDGLKGDVYLRIQKLAREVAIHFEDGSMVEMPVIQRLIWLCYLEAKKEAPAEPVKMEALAAETPAEEIPVAAVVAATESVPAGNGTDFKIINIDRESEDLQKGRGRRHKESALDDAAFELLEVMERTPLSQKADKTQRDAVLEKPALAFVREVLGHLPERVKAQFFSVPLTAYGTERTRAFLNVSFYRKGGKWRGEPQLFFIFTEEGVECGYSIEWFMGLYLERFQMNFDRNEPLMTAWLEDVAADQIGLKANRVRGADGSCAFRAESFIGENKEIRIGLSIPRERILGWSRSRLASSVAEAIVRLFPVLQLALDEDPFAEKALAKPEDIAPIELPAPVDDKAVAVESSEDADDDRQLTLLEAESEEAMSVEIEKTVVLQNIDMLSSAASVSTATAELAIAEMALAKAASEVVLAGVDEAPAVMEDDAEEFYEAARLEPEENGAMEEPALPAPVAAKAEPAVIEEKALEAPPLETSKIEKPQTTEPIAEEMKAPLAAPKNLLEVLAREVEGRSWSESLRPASPPARHGDVEVGTRASARGSDAAVMEEFEVLGLRHRHNAAYPLSQCAEESGFTENQLTEWLAAVDRKGQAVFYGPPGTGKTFMAEKLARNLVGGGDGFTRLIQMHAGVTYDDFIEARRPVGTVGREARTVAIPGRFVEFCREAEGRSGVCVLVLDEMHRADIATVVGELLYLLEHRGQEIQLSGGTRFRVPANVRVIGTMNTADRTNAFLDTAIRRRFAFLELGPRFEVLRNFHRGAAGVPVEELIGVLESVNRRIANKRFEIGITYFLRPDTGRALESIWRTEIEPLVGDYFFDQPGAADAFTWDAVRAHISPR